jgi:hypothetical protein
VRSRRRPRHPPIGWRFGVAAFLRLRPKCCAYSPPKANAITDADELAAMLGKKPSVGHLNYGIAVLRNNGLIDIDCRRYPAAELFRE